MPLDVCKLDKALQAAKAEKAARGVPDGRRASGAFAIVRDNLADLERLNETHDWNEIARALAAQGVLKRDGTQLSGKDLTALIASVRRQAETRAGRTSMRRRRSDFVRDPEPARAAAKASEIAASGTTAPGDGQPVGRRTAEAIRRAEYERTQRFIKTDRR